MVDEDKTPPPDRQGEERQSTGLTAIRQCFSCAVCELSVFMDCPEGCATGFCQSHYIAHMQEAHGYKMTVTMNAPPNAQDTKSALGGNNSANAVESSGLHEPLIPFPNLEEELRRNAEKRIAELESSLADSSTKFDKAFDALLDPSVSADAAMELAAQAVDSSTSDTGLLPCPFCGSVVEISIAYTVKIFCPTCGEIKHFTDEAPAIKWWNTRTPTSDYLRGLQAGIEQVAKRPCFRCQDPEGFSAAQLMECGGTEPSGVKRWVHLDRDLTPFPCLTAAIRSEAQSGEKSRETEQ